MPSTHLGYSGVVAEGLAEVRVGAGPVRGKHPHTSQLEPISLPHPPGHTASSLVTPVVRAQRFLLISVTDLSIVVTCGTLLPITRL
jgi:hypothetical protein